MIDTCSYVPRKEDIWFVIVTKSYCESRQIDFAPGINHNQFEEVLEWCVEFREKEMMEMFLNNPFAEFHDRLNINRTKGKEKNYG